MSKTRPIAPIKPHSMELVFFYACPHCGQDVPAISPLTPAMLNCTVCQRIFPIVPVDQRTVQYVQIMLANGRAAVDPNFI